MPPMNPIANEVAALARENAPVTAAATANWNETTPDASLIRASPWRIAPSRLPSLASFFKAWTATASVGPSAAPNANAAARGIEGTSQWRTNPTHKVITITRPIANETIVVLFSHRLRLSASSASLKSKGAINRTKNSSGSIFTSIGEIASIAMPMPRAIWISGDEMRGTTWSRMEESSTANNSIKISSKTSTGIP